MARIVAWVYLDDRIATHRRIVEAGEAHPLAPWLFVCGLAYCRSHLSGGSIPAPIVPTLTPLYKAAAVKGLIASGLWEVVQLPDARPTAYIVRDYEDWNHSEDAQRQRRIEKARRAGIASGESRRSNAALNMSST